MSPPSRGPSDRVPARAGQVLQGKWRLDNLIAIGGMSTVYAATHRNGKRGAVKLLHYDLSLNEESRTRFLREGYVANKVDHEGAVSVFDDDVCDDGTVYLVMELLEGQTVDTILRTRQSRTFGLGETLRLADRLLDVLASAHDKGVVHRDVKPENLFITDRGKLKVLDFGIARLREASSGAGVTRAGDLLGTPNFMSPEQALGNMDVVDGRSDIWSVGATMFRLLTGRPVHEADTVNRVLLAAMTQPAPPIARVLPAVPAELASVIDRALSFDQAARWQDARSMRAAVRAFAEHGGIRLDGSVLNERDETKVRPPTMAMDAPPAPPALTPPPGSAQLPATTPPPPPNAPLAQGALPPAPLLPVALPPAPLLPGALPPAPLLPVALPPAPPLPAVALPPVPVPPPAAPAPAYTPEPRRAPAAPFPFASSPVAPIEPFPAAPPPAVPPPPAAAPAAEVAGLLPDADDDDDDAKTTVREEGSTFDRLPPDLRARIMGSPAPAPAYGPLPVVRPPTVPPPAAAPARMPTAPAAAFLPPPPLPSPPAAVSPLPRSGPATVPPPPAQPSASPLPAPAPAHSPSFGGPPTVTPPSFSSGIHAYVPPARATGERPVVPLPTVTAAPTFATPTGERPLAAVPGDTPALDTDTPVARDTIAFDFPSSVTHAALAAGPPPSYAAPPRPSAEPEPMVEPLPRRRRLLPYFVFGTVAVLGGLVALMVTSGSGDPDPDGAGPVVVPATPSAPASPPSATTPAPGPSPAATPSSPGSTSTSATEPAPSTSSASSAPAATAPTAKPPGTQKRPPSGGSTKTDPFSSRKW